MSRHGGKPVRIRPTVGRGRSIRFSLVALALIPAVALVALWGSGSAVLFSQWRSAADVGESAKTTYALMPGVTAFQQERRLTMAYLASHGSRTALDAQREQTDAVIAGFRRADAASSHAGSAQYKSQLAVVRRELGDLADERTAVDDRKATGRQILTVYSSLIASSLNLFGLLSTDDGSGSTAAEAAHALAFMRAAEALAQEEAILNSAHAGGTLASQERQVLAAASAVREHLLVNEVAPYLPARLKQSLDKIVVGPDWAALTSFEAAIPARTSMDNSDVRIPRVTKAQAAAPSRVAAQVQGVEGPYLAKVQANGTSRNHDLLVRALTGSAVALLAIAVVGLMSWRITRSLIGRMTSLREETLDLAHHRLPDLIGRLRTEGTRAEADAIADLDFGKDELGKVAEAFNSAQRTAVEAALEQASLREGARQMFLNMSRRTQILVHRQLTVIDAMERKEQDPELLGDLYRVDHLATRLRRNAESLTVLSGSSPRRRWKQAVPLADVVRSAVSEVEGYARVIVEPMPPIAVNGPAVGDTIHLLAELIENGVTFSPPHTEVRVRALPVAQGYAVEVEDRGLGLSPEEYVSANELLHHPQAFDFTTLGEDPRLGLFTVGHLAARHHITASLQASSYGGTLAVVVVPASVTQPVATPAPAVPDDRPDRHLASVTAPEREDVTAGGMPVRTRTVPRSPAAPAPALPPGHDQELGAVPPADGRGHVAPSAADDHGHSQAPSALSGPEADQHPYGSGQLPQRVRQANLAPQLVERHRAPEDGDTGEPRDDERRPEQARSMLAALRDGTRRARAQEEVPAPVWPDNLPQRRSLPTRPGSTRNDS
ncbi:nitrate- and nitrite sensing domain-containing protein [Streptomyces sp. NPDC008150]|uniref:sensor histidine kinase n=1 Tax=Streptomyces sp. NPDC008150 TaxID=3364816 RepID=UPI0036F035E1